eukprot:scaffold114805_cov56-Attheya_sp.AAC.1
MRPPNAALPTQQQQDPRMGSSGPVSTNNSNKSRVRSPLTSGPSKSTHSRSYPRGVGLDFRKLAGLTLMSYIDHHGVSVRPEAPPSELAVAVARHFEASEVNEEAVVGGFLSRLSAGREDTMGNPTFS